MKERRMKTSVGTGKVSLPPAQADGWGVKVGAEHGSDSEKHGLAVEKWLGKPRDERIIAKTTGKNKIEPQVIWEIPGEMSFIIGGFFV